VISKRLKIQGFLATDYSSKVKEMVSNFTQWHSSGQLKYRVDTGWMRLLFVATQSTLAQDDQPWMHIHIEEFDEVSRICRNNCKIVIKRILPHLMIRPTG
jgi:hypothetical protein